MCLLSDTEAKLVTRHAHYSICLELVRCTTCTPKRKTEILLAKQHTNTGLLWIIFDPVVPYTKWSSFKAMIRKRKAHLDTFYPVHVHMFRHGSHPVSFCVAQEHAIFCCKPQIKSCKGLHNIAKNKPIEIRIRYTEGIIHKQGQASLRMWDQNNS